MGDSSAIWTLVSPCNFLMHMRAGCRHYYQAGKHFCCRLIMLMGAHTNTKHNVIEIRLDCRWHLGLICVPLPKCSACICECGLELISCSQVPPLSSWESLTNRVVSLFAMRTPQECIFSWETETSNISLWELPVNKGGFNVASVKLHVSGLKAVMEIFHSTLEPVCMQVSFWNFSKCAKWLIKNLQYFG